MVLQAEKALSFAKNERLRVLAETSETWWIAQRQTEGRQVGFIPAKYVKSAPTAKPRSMKAPSSTPSSPPAPVSPPALVHNSQDRVEAAPEVWLDDFEQQNHYQNRKVSRRTSSLGGNSITSPQMMHSLSEDVGTGPGGRAWGDELNLGNDGRFGGDDAEC
jgi:hypothetical protein